MNGGGEGRRGDEEGETPVLWGLGVLAVILSVVKTIGREVGLGRGCAYYIYGELGMIVISRARDNPQEGEDI